MTRGGCCVGGGNRSARPETVSDTRSDTRSSSEPGEDVTFKTGDVIIQRAIRIFRTSGNLHHVRASTDEHQDIFLSRTRPA